MTVADSALSAIDLEHRAVRPTAGKLMTEPTSRSPALTAGRLQLRPTRFDARKVNAL